MNWVTIYLGANVFLAGTMWEDLKLQEYSIPKLIGFFMSLTFLIFFALPIFIADEVADYCRYKFRKDGINSANILYVIQKFVKAIKLKLFKR